MAKIKQLPLHEAQKIAAGEVVERPANVVKELIENAIDADANQISVFMEDAGKKLIRIVDNGCGMSAEDAILCFNHHATSKISSVEDLIRLQTFGFRGEALSSIAAVSKVILITKEASDQEGMYLERQNNINTVQKSIACNTGTDISISDLFFNVPARKKFLKTHDTEWRAISLMFQAFCLAYQNIHFKLFSENAIIFNCPQAQTLLERIAQLWQPHMSEPMLELPDTTHKNITIKGAISHQQVQRYDRSHIFLFVNNRWIKNHHLSRAVLKGYLNVLPEGRYPAACLFITVPSDHVDINIHPRKEEVQFLHPKIVENNLYDSVRKRLENHLSAQFKKNSTVSYVQNTALNTAEKSMIFAQSERLTAQPETSSLFSNQMLNTTIHFQNFEDLSEPFIMPPQWHEIEPQKKNDVTNQRMDDNQTESYTKTISRNSSEYESQKEASSHGEKMSDAIVDNYKIIGQFNNTYILIEQKDGLFFIDQHAAHERILYEQFVNRFDEIAATTALLFPESIELSPEEFATIVPHIEFFKKHGIELEHFGKNTLVVKSTSIHLKHQRIQDILKEAIAIIQDECGTEQQDLFKTLHHKLRAQMACKAAVKAGDILTMEQMQALLRDLEQVENRFTCPHGRPTGWQLSLRDIEKKFKRII